MLTVESAFSMKSKLIVLVSINRSHPNLVSSDVIKSYKEIYRREISLTTKKADDEYIHRSSNPQVVMWKIMKGSRQKKDSPSTNSLNAQKFNDFFINIAQKCN
nr:unnamed protein product [Callosobruchus analis]